MHLPLFHQNLAVSDLSRVCRIADRFCRNIDQPVGACRHNLNFREKIHDVFRTAVQFRVAFLASETFDFRYRHSGDTDFSQRFSDFIELEGFKNRKYEFHKGS